MPKSCLRLLPIALVACSAKVTQVPFLDRVMTVSEFTAAPEMREKVIAFCRNDPGETAADAKNCASALQSLHVSYSGTGNFPKIDTSVPR